jgi:hypothetical protein
MKRFDVDVTTSDIDTKFGIDWHPHFLFKIIFITTFAVVNSASFAGVPVSNLCVQTASRKIFMFFSHSRLSRKLLDSAKVE